MADNVMARHDFDLGEPGEVTESEVYAFVHRLGTENLVVTARDRHGKPVLCESQIQDGDVVLVTKKGGPWSHGDRILLMGVTQEASSAPAE
jgi:hypothetical protein